MNYFQQGDVLIKPIESLPSWQKQDVLAREKREETSELILALGETTGHAHRLSGKIVKFVPKGASTRNEMVVFEVTEDAVLSHEEHGPITIPAGTYYMEQVREFDHFNNESRYVRD